MVAHPLLKTFQYLILGLCVAMMVVLGQGWLHLALSQSTQEQAEALTHRGRDQLQQGQAEAALQSWQQATGLYRQLNAEEEVAGTLLNQSLALKSMGQLPRACTVLLESLQLDQGWLCDSFINSTPNQPSQALKQALERPVGTPIVLSGLQELGTVLRRLGQLEESELVLTQALELSNRLSANQEKGKIWLRLGDTEQTFYTQARERYAISGDLALQEETLATAQKQARSALQYYCQSIAVSPQPVQLQARLNAITLMVDIQQWAANYRLSEPRLAGFQTQMQQQIKPLLDKLLQTPAEFAQLSPAESVYARLNFALNLNQLHRSAEAIQSAQAALQTAQAVNNSRLRSYSLGILGKLTKESNQAKEYLEQALSLTPQGQAPDMAYQWQHELGQLYRKQGALEKATAAYQAATDSLDEVRGNLTIINPDLQFSFREEVEPVYREYMQVLLESAKPDLKQVIQTNERLQLAELENFLRCGRLPLLSLDTIQANLSDAPAVVHVISVQDRYEVIVRSPDRSLHRYSPDPSQLRTRAENLLSLVQDPGYQYSEPQATQAQGQALYDLLLAPARQNGAIPPAGTLVFVLDGVLQNLPMALLHDGQDYLIRNYSLSVALGSQLQQPRQLEGNKLRALVAGLSERSPSFDAPNAPRGLQPLPQTQAEVASVMQSVEVTKDLLNQGFTIQRLQDAFSQRRYSILHLSTHGEFSSDPKQTVLLDWNQAIDVQQLNQLIKDTLPGESSSALDLLVLSACRSAKGDKRSALGIAGVAIQAGARSTLASLWQVNADSTAQLMKQFYQHLKSRTKAEAVRQAQLSLLNDSSHPEWQHPYYWSSFILAGGWL